MVDRIISVYSGANCSVVQTSNTFLIQIASSLNQAVDVREIVNKQDSLTVNPPSDDKEWCITAQ